MFSCVVSILFTPSPCCYQHYLNVGSVVASQGRQNKVRNLKKILPAQAVRPKIITTLAAPASARIPQPVCHSHTALSLTGTRALAVQFYCQDLLDKSAPFNADIFSRCFLLAQLKTQYKSVQNKHLFRKKVLDSDLILIFPSSPSIG